MNYLKKLNNIKNKINKNITIIVVSKNRSIKLIDNIYKNGHLHFGENYIQEIVKKYNFLPKKIHWHMIGKIQSNKLKYITHFIYMIHSIENIKQLKILNKEANKCNRVIKCLIQIKISEDNNKSGTTFYNAKKIIEDDCIIKMKNIKIVGFMGISSFTNDKEKIAIEFKSIQLFFNSIKKINKNIKILSLGMSNDYKIAIVNNSNMIRIGNKIFN